MNIKELSRSAVLAAMVAVLGMVSLDFGNLKITLESLPILIAAVMSGPISGMAVGFVGTFVYQLLRYGVTVTTILWILPYVVCGLAAGLYAKKYNFALGRLQTVVLVVIAEVIVTTLNTGVMYIDSKVYGYYSAVYIFGTLAPRYALCIGKGIAEGAVIPPLATALSRVGRGRNAA